MNRAEVLAKVLAEHWGCGPGEVVTEFVGADVDGGPGEIAVGQMCRSSDHNYAYWGGTCQFADDAAAALDAALAAQEGERGGAEVTAVAKIAVDHARAEGWRVIACVCGEQWPGRDWNAHREHVEALVAGALATHDAEVWDEGFAAGVSAPANRALGLGNPTNPYCIEAQS